MSLPGWYTQDLSGIEGSEAYTVRACGLAALRGEIDPEAWHSVRHPQHEDAVDLCGACPVRQQCLDLALAMERGTPAAMRYGIWGGMTGDERADADTTIVTIGEPGLVLATLAEIFVDVDGAPHAVPATATHGTPDTYKRHRCRCVPCTAAHREAWADQERRRRARAAAAVHEPIPEPTEAAAAATATEQETAA